MANAITSIKLLNLK